MLKYFTEIKNRFLLLLISGFSTAFVGYFYKEVLLFLVIRGGKSFYPFYFIFTTFFEILNVYLEVIVFLTNQVFVLYFFFHAFFFFSPALFQLEYKYFSHLVRYALLLWFCYMNFFNCVFMPLTLNFFLSFQNFLAFTLYFEAKLNEYVMFYIALYYFCAFYCLACMTLFFTLNYVGIEYIKKFRKLYYYMLIVFSTAASPPDVFIQLTVCLLVITFYEFLLFALALKTQVKRVIY